MPIASTISNTEPRIVLSPRLACADKRFIVTLLYNYEKEILTFTKIKLIRGSANPHAHLSIIFPYNCALTLHLSYLNNCLTAASRNSNASTQTCRKRKSLQFCFIAKDKQHTVLGNMLRIFL